MSLSQPSFGCIEREDLEKFNFSFSSFFGNPKAMRTGVRVHFTTCKEKVSPPPRHPAMVCVMVCV